MLGVSLRAVPFAAVASALALPAAAIGATLPAVPDAGSAVIGTVVPVPAVAPVPLAATTARCSGTHARPSRLAAADARGALLCAVNRARAQHGLPALGSDRHLRRAARGHARDMVRRHYFAHQRPGGPSLADRLRAAGWHGNDAGEALAWGCGSAATASATVRAWLNSAPHRAILLSAAYSKAGIGLVARAPASCGPGATWVLDTGD
jgi:uncharacterized protein YkwD